MQTVSRQASFNIVEENNNNNGTDITNIIKAITNAATQQPPEAANISPIADIPKTLQSLQDKIYLLTKDKPNRKRIVGHMVERVTPNTPALPAWKNR